VKSDLCDRCGRIAYVDQQFKCPSCGDVVCARQACHDWHRRTVTAFTEEGKKEMRACAVGPSMRRLKEIGAAMLAAKGCCEL
jgi:ribosomal protein L37E